MSNSKIDEAKIRQAAYDIWLAEGQPEGRDQAHWLQAVEALNAAPNAAPTKPKAPRKTAAKAAPKAGAKAEAKPKAAPKPRKPKA
jgi:hypothetical protein